jgi:Transposase domain (DUF772)
MMEEAGPQRGLFYQFVAGVLRPRRDLYAPIGRPSIPPEQLFLALVGGDLLGVNSERKLIMEWQCNMALQWFIARAPANRPRRAAVPAGRGRFVTAVASVRVGASFVSLCCMLCFGFIRRAVLGGET